MKRPLVALALLVLAFSALARTRTVSGGTTSAPAEISPLGGGATVNGFIESVNGNIITLAGGLITIDATGAKILTARDKGDATVGDLEPGMLLFATLKTNDVADNAPLQASMISAMPVPDATLFGLVQSVDANAKTFKVLGRTIHVTSDTSFGGFVKDRDSQPGINDVLPDQLVQVQVDAIGGKLVAKNVLVVAPRPPAISHARGPVREIGTDKWVIGDHTYIVNAQTKIAGSPKVGDNVEVLYTTNSAHENVAISILKLSIPDPPSDQNFIFNGTVQLISDQTWVIRKSDGNEVKVQITKLTRIEGGIKIGDSVEVIAIGTNDKLTALVIVRKR